MIKLDFSLAISLYIFLILNTLLIIWLFSKKENGRDLSLDPRFIWFCSVCTYTYVNTKEDTISVCPRCSSYNKKLSEATT